MHYLNSTQPAVSLTEVIARSRDRRADITEAVTVLHQQGRDIFSFNTFQMKSGFHLILFTWKV